MMLLLYAIEKDSSVLKIPTLFKKTKLPGLLLQKEMKEIYKTGNLRKKKLAIIGGAKVSTKVNLINKLIHHCDDIIIKEELWHLHSLSI